MHLHAATGGRGAACASSRQQRSGFSSSSSTPAAARAAGRRRLTVVAAVRAKSKRQICCSKTLVARPEAADQVAKMCADVAEFTQAKMAERSAGINAFDIVRDQWEPNVFHLWERYESNTAMGRHNTTPELTQFMEKVVPLLEQPVGMALYEWQNGQLGPVSLQGGPKGEGGLDDATGASGAAGGAGMKQTSRSFDLGAIEAADRADKDDVFGMPELKRQMEQQFGVLKDMMGGFGKLFGAGPKK